MIINGLDLQQLQQTGVTEEEALHMMRVFGIKHFGDSKIILAGHNIKFDIAFLKKLYQTHGIDMAKRFNHKMIDTVSIIKFLILQRKIKKDLESFD